MIGFFSLLMTVMVGFWSTLIHNKVSTLQFTGVPEKTSIKVRLGKLAYSPLMRGGELLLFVKLPW